MAPFTQYHYFSIKLTHSNNTIVYFMLTYAHKVIVYEYFVHPQCPPQPSLKTLLIPNTITFVYIQLHLLQAPQSSRPSRSPATLWGRAMAHRLSRRPEPRPTGTQVSYSTLHASIMDSWKSKPDFKRNFHYLVLLSYNRFVVDFQINY